MNWKLERYPPATALYRWLNPVSADLFSRVDSKGFTTHLTKATAGFIIVNMKKSKPKNPAAVALGRKGGRTTAKKYTSKQLSEWGKQGGRGNRKPSPLKKAKVSK